MPFLYIGNEKYDFNRKSCKIRVKDTGVAKIVTTEEEEKVQKERMQRLEEAKMMYVACQNWEGKLMYVISKMMYGLNKCNAERNKNYHN